jgi:hypothetical protein
MLSLKPPSHPQFSISLLSFPCPTLRLPVRLSLRNERLRREEEEEDLREDPFNANAKKKIARS